MRGELLTTGIETLDAQLGGGLPAGSTVLILFDPGAGYEIFSAHFTLGTLRSNGSVCYVNTDSPVEEIVEILREFEGNLEKYIESGALEFIDIYSERYASIFPEYALRTSRDDFFGGFDALTSLREILLDERRKGKRIIVDTLSYFLRSYDEKDVADVVELMGVSARASRSIHFLFMSRGMHSEAQENMMKHLCDVVIELITREDGTQIRNYLKILKMKGHFPSRTMIPYELTERGVEVETTRRLL
ncbi:MAG: hypothetical protein PWR13_778 [Archaeoglobi archaeon]|nr:signal transduction protein [Candidatus Mnemosynella bozhongmuii]MDI3502139.1 hypothetical protein [Archaeoglobi archaeon]MDK2781750.1 hypothetical protein [Archaeoglobi archaeon]